MVNRVGFSAQPIICDLPSIKNMSKLSSPLSFRGIEDDETKDIVEISSNKTKEPITDKNAETKTSETNDAMEISSNKTEEPVTDKNTDIETQTSETKDKAEITKNNVAEPVRKFSFNKALQNFGDGFIYPIRQAFNSVTNAAVTLTSIVIVKNLLKKIPELGKPLVAVTAGLGLYNVGKGLIKIVQNKNNPESQEKSFFDIGKGTAITALAGKCSNNALNAGKDAAAIASAGKTNWIKGILNCAKETPAALLSSYKTILNNPKEILGAVLPALPKNIKDGLEALSPGVATATDINVDTSAADPNVIGAESVLTVVQDQFKKTDSL